MLLVLRVPRQGDKAAKLPETMASTETLSFDHVYMHGRTVKVSHSFN